MASTRTISECRLIDFPKIADVRGNLSFIEENKHIPFAVKRVYYLYDVPSGAARGGHAHHNMEAVIIALSGSFDVKLDDGLAPYRRQRIRPAVWRKSLGESFSTTPFLSV